VEIMPRKAKPKKKTATKSRKKKELAARKKNLQKIEKRLKIVDKELYAIEKELKKGGVDSKLMDEELRGVRRRLLEMEPDERERVVSRKFYRNFVVKCRKCTEEFEHKTQVRPTKSKVKCCGCGKTYEIAITPSSRFHHFEFPEDIKVVKHLKGRK